MLAVAVLAAGKGTRMKSALPKVLQPLAGATLVERVLASAGNLQPERRLLIVGHQAERVEQQLAPLGGLEFVLQQPQNGTGHAVQQLIPSLQGFEGELLGSMVMCRCCEVKRSKHWCNSTGPVVPMSPC